MVAGCGIRLRGTQLLVATAEIRRRVALQPVMDIIDRVTIGYEALSRPTPSADPLGTIEAAMVASQLAAPAVVFIHIPRGVLSASGVDLGARAKKLGIPPGQLVWVIRDRARVGLNAEERLQLRRLRDAGCRLAVDAQAAPSLHHSLVAALRPDFIFLDLDISGWFTDDDLARAQLAATMTFVTRLHGLLIARGLDTSVAALAVGDAGVQYGSGATWPARSCFMPMRRGPATRSSPAPGSRVARFASSASGGRHSKNPSCLPLPQFAPASTPGRRPLQAC